MSMSMVFRSQVGRKFLFSRTSSSVACSIKRVSTSLPIPTSSQRTSLHNSSKSQHSGQIHLRDYQQECIDRCLASLESGKRKIAVSLPTGGGKTVIFASLINKIRQMNDDVGKTLVLVHRKELAIQAAQTCKNLCPGKRVEVEMAEYKATEYADIVVASVQTLVRGRLQNWDPHQFKTIIVDEAHHSAADSYKAVFDHFEVDNPNSDIALVGFSATMRREDNKALGEVFEEIVYHMDLLDLIKKDHLTDVKLTTIRLADADLKDVAIARGDFVLGGLSKVINKPSNIDVVIGTYLQFEKDYNVSSTLVFAVDIGHVESLYRGFEEAGVSVRAVTSKTKLRDRQMYVEDFKEGKVSVLINCGVFTEGTDIPNIDCILLVRPTKSRNLLIQMIGRGVRKHHSKDFCHVVDFVGVGSKDLVSLPTLGGLPSDFGLEGMSFADMERVKRQQDHFEQKRKVNESERRQGELVTNFTNEELDAISGLQFTTFESLSNFLSTSNNLSDDEIVRSFDEPWCHSPSKGLWFLVFPEIKPQIHLRLQAHTSGNFPVDFYKGLKTNGFDDTFNKLHSDARSGTVYTLELYQENAKFLKKNPRNFYVTRFNRQLSAPISSDIRVPLMKGSLLASAMLGEHTRPSKRKGWRSEQPTKRQVAALASLLVSKCFKDQTIREQIENILQKNYTRGDLSDFMGSYAIFKMSGLKAIASEVESKLHFT